MGLAFNLAFGVATFLVPIFFFHDIALATLVLLAISLVGLFKWRSRATLYIFVFGALFGVGAEMLAIYKGVWSYSLPSFINVPLWLFLVWGNASSFLFEMGKEFEAIGK
ncbi:hypothetical protein HY640_03235 [Candidatus Woesearchaeota archaeon]|nr:hypothetical protein [Candidatus Woesearchaeota archaeon]